MRPARTVALAADGFYVRRVPVRRGGAMDWPGKTIWSRIAWRWAWLRRPRGQRVRSMRQPEPEPPAPIERLHCLRRKGGRTPLYVLTVTDRMGHVLEAAACDPDEYPEYR
jgi:hypothetical protein